MFYLLLEFFAHRHVTVCARLDPIPFSYARLCGFSFQMIALIVVASALVVFTIPPSASFIYLFYSFSYLFFLFGFSFVFRVATIYFRMKHLHLRLNSVGPFKEWFFFSSSSVSYFDSIVERL